MAFLHNKPKFVNAHKLEKKLQTLSRDIQRPKKTVKQLMFYFNSLTKSTGGRMNHNLFRAEMTYRFKIMDECTLDNIYRVFEKSHHGYLSVDDYVRGMGLFLTDNGDVKTKFCFQVYDLNDDGFITREEMTQWLWNSLMKQGADEETDEGVKELVDITMKKLDCVDHDHRVSFLDFETAVKKDNLLLESLCHCLPSDEYKKTFLLLISGDLSQEIRPSGVHAPNRLETTFGN